MRWSSFEGEKMEKVRGEKKAGEEAMKKRQSGDID